MAILLTSFLFATNPAPRLTALIDQDQRHAVQGASKFHLLSDSGRLLFAALWLA